MLYGFANSFDTECLTNQQMYNVSNHKENEKHGVSLYSNLVNTSMLSKTKNIYIR